MRIWALSLLKGLMAYEIAPDGKAGAQDSTAVELLFDSQQKDIS
jgi:hypothetical protein